MKLKRFVSRDIREAMDLMRAELGPEAVIVHSREVCPRGLSRFWRRPQLEVLAAVEEDRPPRPPIRLPSAADLEQASRLKRLEARLDGLASSVEALAARSPVLSESTASPEITRLIGQNLSEELVQELSASSSTRGSATVASRLRERLPRFAQLTPRGNSPDVFFFLGPTGVGKTTTVAKVAAEFVGRRGYRVGLVAADTFRVAAIPQIEIYADLIGVPLRVAYDADDLRRAVEGFRGCDAVLVDMPGRSPADGTGIAEVDALTGALRQARRLLLLQAGSQLRDLRRAARAFRAETCDGLILTKLDETEVFGPAISIAVELSLPVHYLTVGQNVPEDIEPATADRLLSLLLRGPTVPQQAVSGFERRGLLDLARADSGLRA
ncbi:MAG: hypothetical protein HPY83_01825 [Anaerolineae bacterium]|nr:hypothetical protein [Anaerolineae bacterium]